MLADWFLCSAFRLPPKLTHTYLDLLAALREPRARASLVVDAVDELRRVDSGLMLYALPRVTGAHRRLADIPAVNARASAFYDDLCAVLHTDGDRLRAAFAGMAESAQALFVQLTEIAETLETPEATRQGDPYQDILDHPAVSIVLTLLIDVAVRDVEEVRVWIVDSRPAFLRHARTGEYGRLPLLLATRLVNLVDRSRTATVELAHQLWQFGNQAADLEPDLVAALVEIQFPDGTDPARLEAEAVNGNELNRWRTGTRPYEKISTRIAAVTRIGGEDNRIRDAAAVIWQVTLWERIAVLDPVGAAAVMRRWWQPPPLAFAEPVLVRVPCEPTHREAQAHLGALLGIRGHHSNRPQIKVKPRGGGFVDTEDDVVALLGSPWLFRESDKWGFGVPQQFACSTEAPALLRLCSAALLAVELLRRDLRNDADEELAHLIALIFHLRSVADDKPLNTVLYDLKSARTVNPTELAQSLQGLLHHAVETIDRAGKGEYPELSGSRIARFVLDGPGAREKLATAPSQWKRLFAQSARASAVYWIKESSSGGLPRPGTLSSSGWFDGEQPPALRVLTAVVVAAREGFSANLSDAQRLLREIYPNASVDKDVWDWYRDRDSHRAAFESRNRRASANLLLLSPRYGVQEWTEYGSELSQRLADDGSQLAMLTIRLEALLGEPHRGDVGDHDDWVREWLATIEAINSPWFLSRALRFRMIHLLEAPTEGEGSQLRVDAVGVAVIDAILDISRDAHRYYHQLLRTLARPLPSGDAIADSWRYRAMSLYYQLAVLDPRRSGPRSPYTTATRIRSSRDTERELRAFLRATTQRVITAQAATLGDAVERAWATSRSTHDATVSRTPASQAEAFAVWRDERATLLASIDHYHGQLVRHSHHDDPTRTRGNESVQDLFLPHSERPQTLTKILQSHRPVFAIVCAVNAQTRQIWFNCGLGYPLEHNLQPSDHLPTEGERFAIKLTGSTDQPQVVTGPRPLRRARAVAGEILPARVRSIPDFPGLRVDVDGQKLYLGDRTGEAECARLRWDPDFGRPFVPTGRGPWETLAVYDETIGTWLPVDRTGVDFLTAECAGLVEGRSIPLTFVDHVLAADAIRARFVSTPGRSYLLGEDDFTPESWLRLSERLFDTPTGLIVEVRSCSDGLLELSETPFQDRNLRWLGLFDDDRTFAIAHREGVDWWVDVDAPDGYPSRVRTTGLHGDAATQLCTLGRWSEYQAREQKIEAFRLEDRGITNPEDVSVARYDRLRCLPRGEIVTLVNCIGNDLSQGRLRAFTADGLSVSLPSESVALYAEPGDVHKFVRNRGAQVEFDSCRELPAERTPEAVSAATILDMSSIEDPHRREILRRHLAAGQSLDGMIVRLNRGADRQVHAYSVWLRFDDEVVLVTVPEAAVSVGARHAGDHLTGNRSGEGWVFSVRQRGILARGLYEQHDQRGDTWHFVGFAQHRSRRMAVWQDPSAPRVALTEDHPTSGKKSTVARITRAAPRNFDGKSHIRVVVRQGAAVLVGDAEEYPAGSVVRLRHADLRMRPTGHSGRPSFLISRTFVLDAATVTRAARPESPAEKRLERWREELERNHHHLIGERSGSVLYPGIAALCPDGTWGEALPLREGELPQIEWRNRYRTLTRVRVEPEGDGYIGSFANAEPLTVAEFIDELKLTGDGSREHLGKYRVYYVGDETVGERRVHRFEWGFGWTMDVPAEALRIGGTPIDAPTTPLFHSDRVSAMRFDADAAVTGGIVVHIAPEDIHPSVEGLVMREAGDRVVHEIEVSVDVRRGEVTVLTIHTQSPEASGEAAGSVRTMDHSIAGQMHPDSAAALLLAERDATGPVRRRILAKLKVDDSRFGRFREFSWVPLTGEKGLKPGAWIYLKVTRAWKSANDSSLEFRLPESIDPGNSFSVRVQRRRFSHRPGLLDRTYELKGNAAFRNHMMLVKLLSKNDRGWQGAVTGGPARPFQTLLSWIRHNRGTCYATMGAGASIEVNPGVFYRVPNLARQNTAEGTLVRISETDDRRGVLSDEALPAHSRYVHQGRVVVAFPKDPLLRPNGVARAKSRGQFTIAGLPDLEATLHQSVDAKLLLGTSHPKVLFAALDGPNVILHDGDDLRAGNIFAATLEVNDADADVRIRLLDGSTRAVPWARLSYLNATATDIAERLRTNTWKYHDSRTGRWIDDTTVETVTFDEAQINALSEPVVFSSENGPTLRYRRNELDRFALPATELLDRTDNEHGSISLVVAGSDSNGGLWVELGPGRVVQIPASLFVQAGIPLARLDWSRFAAGDEITVQKSRDSTGYPTLELRAWRPGVRAAFGNAPGPAAMLLPMQHILSQGGLLLGHGRDTTLYPVDAATAARFATETAVWLNRRNDIKPLARREVAKGDIVLLGVDATTGELRIHGLPATRVDLAPVDKASWPTLGWLRRELSRVDTRIALLNQLGGSVPVTVERVSTGENGALEIAISRRHQPPGWWPRNRLARTEVAAVLADHTVIVRAGAALRQITMEQAVPGSGALASKVAAALAEPCDPMWWTVGVDGLPRTGLPETHADERQVRVLRALVDETGTAGFICRDIRSQAMGLLSARDASWAEHKTSPTLASEFDGSGPVAVTKVPHGGFSVVHRPLVAREFELLTVGAALQVRVIAQLTDIESGGRFVQLARARLTEVLLTVSSDFPLAVDTDLSVEISGKRKSPSPTVTGEPIGTRKTVLDLPTAVAAGLRAVSAFNSRPEYQALDLATARFAEQRAAYRDGLVDVPHSADPEERIVRAAGIALDDPDDPRLPSTLSTWLRAGGFDTVVARDECELLPTLSACVVAGAVAQTHTDIAALSVLMAHQLGRRAVRSTHVEVLVTQWLTRRDRHTADGGWRRMANLKLDSRLDASDADAMLRFCQAVLAKPVIHGAEDDRASVARALAASVGRSERIDRIDADAPLLAPLAALSRALSPADGRRTAQRELLSAQRDLLGRILRLHLSQTMMPLPLLPPAGRLPNGGWQLIRSAMSRLEHGTESE